jgi:hypothetical protein
LLTAGGDRRVETCGDRLEVGFFEGGIPRALPRRNKRGKAAVRAIRQAGGQTREADGVGVACRFVRRTVAEGVEGKGIPRTESCRSGQDGLDWSNTPEPDQDLREG